MSPVDAPRTTYEICLLVTNLWFALMFMLNFVNMNVEFRQICLLVTNLWFALMFMLNFVNIRCLGDTETLHARYYFVVIVVLEVHYRICVRRRINTVLEEIDMTAQRDASRTPEMANSERMIGELKSRHQETVWVTNYEHVIGELKNRQLKNRHQETMWARFVCRTLHKDRVRVDEIAYLMNEVQHLKRLLERSWLREEVLDKKILECNL